MTHFFFIVPLQISGEFEPTQSSDDDEETIAKAEQEEVVDHSKEVDMLKQESELPLEDFLKSLPKDYLANRHKKLSSESVSIFLCGMKFLIC